MNTHPNDEKPYSEEEVARALRNLCSVLCDVDGRCCIAGSDADRLVVDESLGAIAAALRTASQPAAPASASEADEVAEWVKRRMPESLHGLSVVELLDLLCEGGIAAERDALHQSPSGGLVMAPREPTPEMLRAGFLSESGGFDIETPADAPGLVYRAMIEAAPSADGREVTDG